MRAKDNIREALKRLMSDGEANACEIWKGWDIGTGAYGWHYERFGQTATYLGSNVREALETIEQTISERTEVG